MKVFSLTAGGASSGLVAKTACRIGTAAALPANTRTANILLADANGAWAGHASADGLTPDVGDRVLVKNEATGANNGIYVVDAVGTAGAKWQMTRASDAASSADVVTGMLVPVSEGTANADKIYQLTTNAPITLNTTALTFAQPALTPAAHATSHESGGSDAIKLDNLAAPDDNTDLNASTSAHGLQKKLSNIATEYADGIGGYSVPAQIPGGYLQVDSTTQVSYQRDIGDVIEVNALRTSIGSSGLTLTTSINLLSSTGTDSGGAMAASTLYYLYVSNASGSFRASSLSASATAPSRYNGIYYLATSGNGANYRFVGWVYTNASTQFVNTVVNRHLVNYYNRRNLGLFLCPGYVDNDTNTTYNIDGTSFQEANGTGNGTLSFIATGEDDIPAALSMYCSTNYGYAAFCVDGLTDARGMITVTTGYGNGTALSINGLSAGRHRLILGLRGDAAGARTFLADTLRSGVGTAADVPWTWIAATIRG